MIDKILKTDDVRTDFFRGMPPWGHDLIINFPPFELLTQFSERDLPENLDRIATINGYLHVPFCEKTCNYCHFSTVPNPDPELIKRWMKSALFQVERWKEIMPQARAKTMYIGGGTPSFLSPDMLEQAIHLLTDAFPPLNKLYDEFTVEANPHDLLGEKEKEKLRIMRELGVNRISVGVQSMDDTLLILCNRSHNSRDVTKSLNRIRELRIENINVDLIYGLPNQTMRQWESTLERILEEEPQSITIHELRLKEHTPFYDNPEIRNAIPDPETRFLMHLEGWNRIIEAGYLPIEEGAFVKPGFDQIHQKIKCRDQGNLIGIGPSAYSFIAGALFYNERFLKYYFEETENRRLPIGVGRRLTTEELKARRVVLGLFFFDGVSRADYVRDFGNQPEVQYGNLLRELEKHGLLTETDGRIHLTPRGGFHSNRIRYEFYLREQQEALKEVPGAGVFARVFRPY